jgi:hypothetical protein
MEVFPDVSPPVSPTFVGKASAPDPVTAPASANEITIDEVYDAASSFLFNKINERLPILVKQSKNIDDNKMTDKKEKKNRYR